MLYVLCRLLWPLLWPQLWPIHQFPIFCFAARGPVVAVVAEQTCRRCLPGQRVEQGGEAGEEVTGQPHHLQRWVVRQRHRQRAQVVVAHVWGAGDCIYQETTLKSYLQSPGLGCSETCWVANF